MSHVTVKVAECHSIRLKRKLAQAVTHALVSTLNTKPEWVTVHVDKFESEN
ncbi:4-oxalocrotonate tautomerase [Scytonema tolypothrichoides VB-61278]|nr:4-oxalocrotonate tautomerase [Scytonema tolypothrichoides VB-61278]